MSRTSQRWIHHHNQVERIDYNLMYHQVDTSGNNPHYFRTVFVFRAGSGEICVTIESIGDGMVPFNLISRSLAVMGGLTITCL